MFLLKRKYLGKRALIYGAYGNGNLGDTYQARSLARLLEEALPGIDVWAISRSQRYYHFNEFRKVPASKLKDLDWINSFDLFVIGGGGLLASKHRPLDNPDWINRLNVPVVILGVGATPAGLEQCSALLERACYVSVRDDYSLNDVRRLRSDADFYPDPILVDQWNFNVTKRYPRERGLTFILRKVSGRKRELYQSMKTDVIQAEEKCFSIFPSTDHGSGIDDIFDPDQVSYIENLDSLFESLSFAGGIVSNRLHGCIIGLKGGVPALGMDSLKDPSASKIFRLYELLGIQKFCISTYEREISRREILDLIEEFPSIKSRLRKRIKELNRYAVKRLRSLGERWINE